MGNFAVFSCFNGNRRPLRLLKYSTRQFFAIGNIEICDSYDIDLKRFIVYLLTSQCLALQNVG